MTLFSLILYGTINVAMVAYYLRAKGTFYQFPFWAATFSLGWFFPQAIGGYLNVSQFPEYAYEDAMLFASLCSLALWGGFIFRMNKTVRVVGWLDASFDPQRLYLASAVLCLIGFYFQWRLWSLPEELLAVTQPSGIVVKYLFLGNIFKLGFISLWLLGLWQSRLLSPKFLVFLGPGLLLFLEAILLRGRRAIMMELLTCIVFGLWFARRISIPRWIIISGLSAGLLLINGIGVYRQIMQNQKDVPLAERFSQVAEANYLELFERKMRDSGEEFKNYVYARLFYADTGNYDYGGEHWNRFVFNFVPAQIVGRELKKSLMLDNQDVNLMEYVKQEYGHSFMTGMTMTGYTDCFGSFGWFGFVKFWLVGFIMAALYSHAMQGSFLGSFLYIFAITDAIQTISHGTHDILVRIWIYFFVLGYPAFLWAKNNRRPEPTH